MDYDFSTLPPHVLVNILSHLQRDDFNSATQTCKTWYYASCDPMITQRLMIKVTASSPDLEILRRPVAKLVLQCSTIEKFDYIKLLQRFGHKITELQISSCISLRITQLFEMFIHLTNLKVLRLEYGFRYYKPSNNFYNHGRLARQKGKIMENLGRVRHLHIDTIEEHLKGAEILLKYCTNLVSLYWAENIYTNNTKYFTNDVLLNPDNHCILKSVESLTIRSVPRNQNSWFFETLTNFNLSNLRALNVKEISGTYYDAMFQKFCETYNSLETLTMYGCNDQQLMDVCKYMRKLKTLNLEEAIATNVAIIGGLTNLEHFKLLRTIDSVDAPLIDLFRIKSKKLIDLTLNRVSTNVLRVICANMPQLKRLYLKYVETKECEPVFRHLTKLKRLSLEFTEKSSINSKWIQSDPVWNVTKLVDLEYLYVNTFLPGFTPELIAKLPKLRTNHHQFIYDVADPEDTEDENQNYENKFDEQNWGDYGWGSFEVNPQEEENREYSITEFDFFADDLCHTDVTMTH